jgi:hypothetical protein
MCDAAKRELWLVVKDQRYDVSHRFAIMLCEWQWPDVHRLLGHSALAKHVDFESALILEVRVLWIHEVIYKVAELKNSNEVVVIVRHFVSFTVLVVIGLCV